MRLQKGLKGVFLCVDIIGETEGLLACKL